MGFMDFFYNGVEYQDADTNRKKARSEDRQSSRFRSDENDFDQRQIRQAVQQSNFQPPKHEYYAKPEVKSSSDSMVNVNGIHMHYPQSYEEVQNIIDDMKKGCSVIADLHQVKDTAAQRILDFISGAVYALDGQITKIRQSLYLLSPASNNKNGRNE